MAINLATGFRKLRFPVAISYQAKTSNAPNTYADAFTVPHAHRTAPTKRDVELLADCDAVFTAWLAELGDARPRPGDRITAPDGVAWTVLDVEIKGHGQRYRMPVKKER